ncbi:sigma-54 interaction domain-containing protein [Syntrophomonas curvata]
MGERKVKAPGQRQMSGSRAGGPSLPENGNNATTAYLDYAQVKSRQEERMDLDSLVQSLSELLASSGTISNELLVTDEEGFVLYRLNRKSAGGVPEGCCLAVEASGVNALGLALKSLETVKIAGKKHSRSGFKQCISLGIPIVDGGRLIACVGYILPENSSNLLDSGILDNIIRTLVQAAVKMLEARKSLDELYLLKEFFNHLDPNQGNMVVDSALNIIQVNRQAEILLGLPKEELIDLSLPDITVSLPPDISNKDSCESRTCKLLTCSPAAKVEILTRISPVCSDYDRCVGWHLSFEAAKNDTRKESKKTLNKYEFKDIVGQNKEFMKLLGLANAVAKSPSNVLISGESGTGKELFAQAIHNASACANGPFVAINCAAIPRELIETEMFGYVEGAFTGARKQGMQGKFLCAHKGSLFLDEIGDMPLELQPKLLRVLQERSIVPVGGSTPIPVDIRVISATNQKLEELIAANKFRADLFYRLNVINLRLPPLRERKDDIPLLAQFFIAMVNKKLHKRVEKISDAAMQVFMDYHWPGNIRQLENTIETAVNLADDIIDLEHIGLLLGEKAAASSTAAPGSAPVVNTLEEMEKIEIARALNQCDGNVTQAALILNIGRATLYRKIKKYQIL